MDNGESSFVDVWGLTPDAFSANSEGAEEITPDDTAMPEQPSGEGDTEPNSDAVVVEDQGAEQGDGEPAENGGESENNASSDAPTDTTAEVTGAYEGIMSTLVDGDILSYDEDKEYDVESEAGLQEMITDTVTRKSAAAVEEYKAGLGDRAGALVDILEKGGSVADFEKIDQQVDFSQVKLEDANGEQYERNQEHLVEDWLTTQGYSTDDAKDLVYDYKENGMLRKHAEMSQRMLAEHQAKENEGLLAQRETEKAEQTRVAQEEADTFKESVLGTRELSGFNVTEKKAQKMYDYITLQDKEGKTQFQKDDTPENRLLYAMFAMDGFNKDSLTKEVATKQARSFKKKLSNFKDTNVSPKRGGNDIRRDGQGAPKISWLE